MQPYRLLLADVCEASAIWADVAKTGQDAEPEVPYINQGSGAVRSAPRRCLTGRYHAVIPTIKGDGWIHIAPILLINLVCTY